MDLPKRNWEPIGVIPAIDHFDGTERPPSAVDTLAWDPQDRAFVRRAVDGWMPTRPDGTEVIGGSCPLDEFAELDDDGGPTPMGVFVSDDGSIADLEWLGPLCQDKQVPFVLAVARDFVGRPGYMSLRQLHEMGELGCELVSHSASHPHLSYLRARDVPREVGESVNWMRDQGWATRHYVYPYGEHRVAVERAVADLCDSACVVAGGVARRPFLRTQVPRHAFGSFFEQGVSTFDGYRRIVDEAVEARCMLVWMLHPWSDDHDSEQHALLVDLIDYMRDAGMSTVSLTEAWETHGNRWDETPHFGERTLVDCRGVVWRTQPRGGPLDELARRTIDTPIGGIAIDGLRRARARSRRFLNR